MPVFATAWRCSVCLVLVCLMGTAIVPAYASDLPSIDRHWEEAFNRGDVTALLALYTADAKIMPPGQPVASGLDAVRAVMTAHVGTGLEVDIDVIETEAEGDLAYQIGTWSVSNADGKLLDHGKFMQVWKLVNGEWRIHRDIWNGG